MEHPGPRHQTCLAQSSEQFVFLLWILTWIGILKSSWSDQILLCALLLITICLIKPLQDLAKGKFIDSVDTDSEREED